MLCENAYYPNKTGENREKPCCLNEKATDFEGRCPLIYWCPISERYENTADMFNCKYREKENEKNDD